MIHPGERVQHSIYGVVGSDGCSLLPKGCPPDSTISAPWPYAGEAK